MLQFLCRRRVVQLLRGMCSTFTWQCAEQWPFSQHRVLALCQPAASIRSAQLWPDRLLTHSLSFSVSLSPSFLFIFCQNSLTPPTTSNYYCIAHPFTIFVSYVLFFFCVFHTPNTYHSPSTYSERILFSSTHAHAPAHAQTRILYSFDDTCYRKYFRSNKTLQLFVQETIKPICNTIR